MYNFDTFYCCCSLMFYCYRNTQSWRKEKAVAPRGRGKEEKGTWSWSTSWSHLDAWEWETGDTQVPQREYAALCFCPQFNGDIIVLRNPCVKWIFAFIILLFLIASFSASFLGDWAAVSASQSWHSECSFAQCSSWMQALWNWRGH